MHGGLVIGRRGKGLALLGGNRRVAVNQLGEDAAQRLDAERQRRHVQQQHILDFAAQHAALHGRAHRYHFVRVHALVGILAKHRAHQFGHLRDAGGAAHHHHFVDLLRCQAGVGHRLFARAQRALENIVDHLLKPRAGDLQHQVLGTAGVGGDKRQIDLGLQQRRELNLGLLGRFLEPLQRHLILGEIDALFLLELADDPLNHALVDVVAAQMGVAIGGLHFHHAVAHFEDRDVERAAAKVIDRDGLIFLLVKAVGERGRRRLIDDTHHLQARNLAGVLGGLPLRVVEVGRHRDHRFGDLLAQVGLGGFLELAQHHGGNFRRGHLLALRVHAGIAVLTGDDLIRYKSGLFAHFVKPASHEALDRIDGILGVGHGLPLGHLTDQTFAAFGKADNRRCRAPTFLVGDDDGLAAFHHGDDGVGRAQVNANDFAHSDARKPPNALAAPAILPSA